MATRNAKRESKVFEPLSEPLSEPLLNIWESGYLDSALYTSYEKGIFTEFCSVLVTEKNN